MNQFLNALSGIELLKAKNITYLKLVAISVGLFTLLGISSQAYKVDTSAFLLGISALFMTAYFIYFKKVTGAVYSALLVMPTVVSLFFYKYAYVSFWLYLIAAVLLVTILVLWKKYRIELPICILMSISPLIASIKGLTSIAVSI